MKHHWRGSKPNPNDYFGFVYLITNKIDGRMYYGKKQYHRWSKRKIIGSNNWEFYTGSSKELNKDIKTHGIQNFEFKIIKNYKTRGGLTYGEVNIQHKKEVLTKRHPDDPELRLFYNKMIGAIKFIPKEW